MTILFFTFCFAEFDDCEPENIGQRPDMVYLPPPGGIL